MTGKVRYKSGNFATENL